MPRHNKSISTPASHPNFVNYYRYFGHLKTVLTKNSERSACKLGNYEKSDKDFTLNEVFNGWIILLDELLRLMDKRHLNHPTHGVLQMQDFLFAIHNWD